MAYYRSYKLTVCRDLLICVDCSLFVLGTRCPSNIDSRTQFERLGPVPSYTFALSFLVDVNWPDFMGIGHQSFTLLFC